jgi:small subunit ribosomal protein S11e
VHFKGQDRVIKDIKVSFSRGKTVTKAIFAENVKPKSANFDAIDKAITNNDDKQLVQKLKKEDKLETQAYDIGSILNYGDKVVEIVSEPYPDPNFKAVLKGEQAPEVYDVKIVGSGEPLTVPADELESPAEPVEYYVGYEIDEKAFQKQEPIFIGAKRLLGKKSGGKLARYWKNPGLSFSVPKEAKEGTYIDKKCPFTGSAISLRGKVLKGMCVSTKMKNTVVLRRCYLHYIKKYKRFEKRHSILHAHCSPCFDMIKEGDVVTVAQCRPLAKTVRFNVMKVQPNQVFGNARKQFALF